MNAPNTKYEISIICPFFFRVKILIEAVIVTREFSEPVLIRSFTKTFEPIKSVLISQVLEAIRGLAEKELRDVLQEVKLGERTIYLWKVREFVISIVTDGQESREVLEDLVHDISSIIINYEPEEIMLDEQIQKRVSREIASFVLMERMGINVLKEIVDELRSLMEMVEWKGKELKIKSLRPKIMKPRKSFIRLIRSVRKASLNYLLEPFLKGDLDEAIKRSSDLLGHEEFGDWAKALYVKVGVILNTRPMNFPAPSREDLLGVAETISNELLRELMVEWVKSLWDATAVYRLRMRYIENRQKFIELMKQSPEIEQFILIILLGIPDMRILVRTITVFRDKSDFLVSMAYAKQLLLHITGFPIKNVADWLRMHSHIRRIYDQYSDVKGGEFLALPLVVSYIWALSARDIKEEDIKMVLDALKDFWSKNKGRILRGNNLLSSCHRAAIKLFSYYVPNLLDYYSKRNKNILKILVKELEEHLSSALNHYENRRILNMMFYDIVIASLLDVYARATSELGIKISNIAELIESAIDPDMSRAIFVNRFHMMYYVLAIHSALSHTLLQLPESSMRLALAEKLLDLASILAERVKKITVLALQLIPAYKKLLNSVPEEVKAKYIDNYDTLLEELPQTIRSLMEG